MKKLATSLLAVGALALAPGGLAAGGAASLTITPASVPSGTLLNAKACVATSGDGGYLIAKGPGATARDISFGPATPCSSFQIDTTGWVAGKYRIDGYEFTAKGSKGIGSATITVT
jgi:hypothetical protein